MRIEDNVIFDYNSIIFYVHIPKSGGSTIREGLMGYFNHNEVVNALDFIAKHTIMLVPLFSGSGLRVKIIEGMAMGKCIISTRLGAKGVPYTDRKNILIADTKEEFISTMQFCYNNINQVNNIGLEARKFAMEHFSKEKVITQLEKIL